MGARDSPQLERHFWQRENGEQITGMISSVKSMPSVLIEMIPSMQQGKIAGRVSVFVAHGRIFFHLNADSTCVAL